MRLLAATDHIQSIARLLEDPPNAYGPAAAARAVLECSARAWWDLDPSLDVRGRVLRGMIDRAVSLVEGSKIPDEKIREHQQKQLETVLAGARHAGLQPRLTPKGRLIGIAEVNIPTATELIRAQLGKLGEVTYRYLSAGAHGVLWGLTTPTRQAGRVPGRQATFVEPVADIERHAPYLALTLNSFFEGFSRQVKLCGWDDTEWNAWSAEARQAVVRVAAHGSQ